MKFKKYPSIENSYREKHINRWLKYHPELADEKFIIVEKIHGANFQILIDKENVRFASRNKILEDGINFFDYQRVMDNCSELIEDLQKIVLNNNFNTMRVYGELFGGNIQRGVDYGSEKKFKIFDICIDDIPLPQREVIMLLKAINSEDYFVPILDIVVGLNKAMQYDSAFDTKLNSITDNISEGVVIKPFENIYVSDQGSVFYLKKKNEKFIQKQKSSNKSRGEQNEELTELQEVFADYLNENRVQGIFSKYGEIESMDEISKYISLVLNDAREDFLKDNIDEVKLLKKKDRSRIFSITGRYVVPILKEYL